MKQVDSFLLSITDIMCGDFFNGSNVCDWSNSMKLPPSIVVRTQERILSNYVAKNLKRVSYVIVTLNKFILPCFECKKQRVQAITAVAALTADNAAK